ncbi:hypothetical protein TSOC_009194, partial [Tetrabaena socialis]
APLCAIAPFLGWVRMHNAPVSKRCICLLLILCGAIASRARRAKPEYCRTDLPGCCPKVVEHVLLLHIEKTGGTSLRTFLQSAVKRRFKGRGAICNYLKHMPYQCQPSSAAGGNSSCNARNYAYYQSAITTGDHFRRGCKLTSSHHDFRIVDAIPPHIRNTTLLIVNLRDPAGRAVSHFHMLRRHRDPGALNSTVVDYFVRNPLGVAISRNRMTRVMAGEFCCKKGLPAVYESDALYGRARARLEEFCVVGLTSRVQETMLYVQHVLGQVTDRPPKNLHYHNNANRYQPVDPAVLQQLDEFNGNDVELYKQAEGRFGAQMLAIGRSATDNSTAAAAEAGA